MKDEKKSNSEICQVIDGDKHAAPYQPFSHHTFDNTHTPTHIQYMRNNRHDACQSVPGTLLTAAFLVTAKSIILIFHTSPSLSLTLSSHLLISYISPWLFNVGVQESAKRLDQFASVIESVVSQCVCVCV